VFPLRTSMERNLKLNDLKNKRKLPENFTNKYPQLSNLIIKMTDNNPENRPNAKEVLKMLETELSSDFKSKEEEDSISHLGYKGNSVEIRKSEKENRKNRLRFFSEDIQSLPALEFKMKNYLQNSWIKM